MKLSRAQRFVVFLGVLILFCMLVYPPYLTTWTFRTSNFSRSAEACSYALIFKEPTPETPTEVARDGAGRWSRASRIDVGRLTVQCLAVAMLTATAVVALGWRRPKAG